MAANIYLTFYYMFDAERLRKMNILYLAICYDIPFIPAVAFVFLADEQGRSFYGNATLWCWIATEWDVYRVTVFYGPVWVSILVTFLIYIRTSREIYLNRKQLHSIFTWQDQELGPYGSADTIVVSAAEAAAGRGARREFLAS